MSDDEREALKGALTDGYWARTGYRVTWQHLGPLMDAILESDWLRAHDAKVRAEQREADAQIAEADQFWDPRGEVLSSDEVSYNVARREAAAAIRAVPANTNTEEGN